MRRFTDRAGRRWDVVAGRESWGAVFAIFIPHDGGTGGDAPADSPVIRQTPLHGAGYGEATTELDRLSEDDLRAMLDRSEPKNHG